MKIASVQMPNSKSVEKNFNQILNYINSAIKEDCDLILFPECALSGFTAEMKKCSMEFLLPYLDQVQAISSKNNITVILPSAYAKEDKIYNAIFIFDENKITIQYKIGLTESEKNFFSIPETNHSKIFTTKGIRIGILVCYEAQVAPDTFFKADEVDLILWPGYVLSGAKAEWNTSEKNAVYNNMLEWRVPLIQSNFSYNDPSIGKDSGPDGHSVVLDKNNRLVIRGKYQENDLIVCIYGEKSISGYLNTI